MKYVCKHCIFILFFDIYCRIFIYIIHLCLYQFDDSVGFDDTIQFEDSTQSDIFEDLGEAAHTQQHRGSQPPPPLFWRPTKPFGATGICASFEHAGLNYVVDVFIHFKKIKQKYSLKYVCKHCNFIVGFYIL